jgi:undecaprenyl-diphosphatase
VDYAQAIILRLIRGVTELFPVASLGHSVILPALFGWKNVPHWADCSLTSRAA